MTQSPDLGKMIPGFEFLQDLARNSGAALPGLSHWVAPTLDPDEIGRRIEELRTVQFWLEQNGRMLGTTIQALEVQRMTLSTLKTMNVQVADLTEAFKIRMPEAAAPAPSPAASAPSAAPPAAGPARGAKGRKVPPATGANPGPAPGPTSGAAPGVVDPVQWWNALTQQFTQIAAKAMQDGSVESAAQMARTLVRNSADAMGQALDAARVKPDAAAARPHAAPAAAPAAAPTRKTRAKAAARGGR